MRDERFSGEGPDVFSGQALGAPAGGDQRDLDFRGAGVGGAAGVGGDDLCLVEFSHADFL